MDKNPVITLLQMEKLKPTEEHARPKVSGKAGQGPLVQGYGCGCMTHSLILTSTCACR